MQKIKNHKYAIHYTIVPTERPWEVRTTAFVTANNKRMAKEKAKRKINKSYWINHSNLINPPYKKRGFRIDEIKKLN